MFREVTELSFEHAEINDLPGIASRFLQEAADLKVWLFTGEMGAGKTTFIKALCSRLGVEDTMSSPTFSIINEYASPAGSIFHFDFFRVRDEHEAADIGTEEYFYSGNFCFVEWPEKIPGLIPDHYAHVRIDLESQTLRTLVLTVHVGEEKNRI